MPGRISGSQPRLALPRPTCLDLPRLAEPLISLSLSLALSHSLSVSPCFSHIFSFFPKQRLRLRGSYLWKTDTHDQAQWYGGTEVVKQKTHPPSPPTEPLLLLCLSAEQVELKRMLKPDVITMPDSFLARFLADVSIVLSQAAPYLRTATEHSRSRTATEHSGLHPLPRTATRHEAKAKRGSAIKV